MRHLCSIPTAAAVVVVIVGLSAGCSGGHGSSSSTTTPTSFPTTSSSGKNASRTSTSSRPNAPTTAAATTPTTGTHGSTNTTAAPPSTGGAASTVRITDFRSAPPSPVSCNAPTQIELSWTTSGATKVTLSLDGRVFAMYGPGPQDHLEYFACDRRPHTYTLRAEGGGQVATATKVIASY
jgi:hypothetical protein